MEQNSKTKSLTKLFNMLVIPKVNELEPITGHKIVNIEVRESENDDYIVIVNSSYEKEMVDTGDFSNDNFYVGMSHLFLNTFVYVVPHGTLYVEYRKTYGTLIDEYPMVTWGYRESDNKAIENMLTTTWR